MEYPYGRTSSIDLGKSAFHLVAIVAGPAVYRYRIEQFLVGTDEL